MLPRNSGEWSTRASPDGSFDDENSHQTVKLWFAGWATWRHRHVTVGSLQVNWMYAVRVSDSQMAHLTTASYLVTSRWVLRRRAGRLAAAFGLLIAAVWVVGGLLHQDLLAGLLVLAGIVVGGFLFVTVTQMLTRKPPTEDSRTPRFEWEEERDRNPVIPGTKAYWTYGQQLLDRDRDD